MRSLIVVWALLALASMSAAAGGKELPGSPLKPRHQRTAIANAALVSSPRFYRCRTEADWDAEVCTVQPGSTYDASAFDKGIGVMFPVDGVISVYTLRFTAPAGGTIYDIRYNKRPETDSFCPSGYVYADLTGTYCYYGETGILLFLKRRAGQWKVELLADSALQWTGYSNAKPAEIRKLSGDGQSAPVGENLRTLPQISLTHFDGGLVDVAETSTGVNTDIIAFTITGPSRATGMSVESPTYLWHATSASINVRLGNKTGTYTATGSMAGTTMPSPFTFTAVPQQEGPDQPANEEGTGKECGKVLDPVTVALGNSFQQETDYERTGLSMLEFTRSYNAMGSKSKLMHNYWTTSFDRFVILPPTPSSPARVRRPDGRTISYFPVGGAYQSREYFQATLTKTPTGWRYVDVDQTVEVFDSTGKLLSITEASGLSLSMTYDSKPNLTKVTANTGESLAFTYNSFNQMATMTDNGGRVWTYAYNGYANLVSVKRPDGTGVGYGYHDATNPYLLTALTRAFAPTSELAQADAQVVWSFDTQGRVTGNYVRKDGQNTRGGSIAYLPDGSRIVTDTLGRSTTYKAHTVNGRGFVDGAEGPGFASCGLADSQLEYNANMDVTARTSFGRRTEYGGFDTKGQNAFSIDAAGTTLARRTDYTYDARFIGKPTTITSPSVLAGQSRVETFSYDPLGNLTQRTTNGFRPDGTAVSRTTTFEYAGPFGQVSKVDGPRTDVADVTRFDYDATSKRLIRVTDADGIILRSNILYTPRGQVASETRPNGLAIAYTYVPGTNLLATMTETQGTNKRTTTWTYNNRQEVAGITFSDGKNRDLAVTFFYDDVTGELIKIENPGTEYATQGGGSYPSAMGYIYDSEGNVVRESKGLNTQGNGSVAAMSWVDKTLDEYNRVDKVVNAVGMLDYDFHPDGTLTRLTDGNSKPTSYEYDALKRMTRQLQPGNILTQFAYDARDNLTQVTDGNGAVTTYAFDDLGNRVRVQSPDSGTQTFTYDIAGNLIQSVDAMGQTTVRQYSPGGRILSVDRPGVAEDEVYAYDSCTNGAGRLCSVTMGNGEYTAYEYDAFGRPSLLVSRGGGAAYEYDAKDNVTAITYPSGRRVTYAYNSAGQATSVSLQDGVRTTALAGSIRNLPFGPADSWTYGNGLKETRSFNSSYMPTSLGVAGKFQITFPQYDGNGNLLQRVLNGQAESYAYDDLNRLQGAAGGFGLRAYEYDAVGNRTKLTADGVVTTSAYGPQSNRIANSSTGQYVLDANGSSIVMPRAGAGSLELGYSKRNQLESVAAAGQPPGSTAVYLHNSLGQRTLKSLNGSERRYLYDPQGHLLAESLADGSIVEEYVYLNGQPLALLGLPNRPQTPSIDAIVDETAGIFVGPWVSKKVTYAYNTKFLQLTLPSTSTNSFSWNWLPPVSGLYDIWTWWVRKPTDGIFTYYEVEGGSWIQGIRHSEQTQGSWAYLGRLHLTAGLQALSTSAYQGGSPSAPGTVLDVDAARFKLIEVDTGTELNYGYVISDQLGTPQAVTNRAGAIVWKATYDPFGQATVNADPDADGIPFTLNIRFPGQYFDVESGLNYNRYRDYNPETGRYLESDPMGLEGGLNTFGYAAGNPISNTDSLGLLSDCEKNALANGLAQATPFVGAGLSATGTRFTPFGSGPAITKSSPSLWDIGSNILTTTGWTANTKAGDRLAQSYIDSRFRDLSSGNRAERRALQSANQTIWSGAKRSLRFVGRALQITGAVIAAVEAYQDFKACSSCNPSE